MPSDPATTQPPKLLDEYDRPQATATVNVGPDSTGLYGPWKLAANVTAVVFVMGLCLSVLWWSARFIEKDRMEAAALLTTQRLEAASLLKEQKSDASILLKEQRMEAQEYKRDFQKLFESQQASLNANNHNLAGMTNMVNGLIDAVKKLNSDVDMLRADVKALNKVAARLPADGAQATVKPSEKQ